MKEYDFECPVTNEIYTIKVGENAQENWEIIGEANGSDIWFHVDKFPSCHVVLNANSIPLKKIHRSVINFCASICKEGSKQKNSKKVSIIYTEIRNVTINKKGAVGSVFTRKTKNTTA
jgi:predicted ribosome quality control (RQC) complex YloA/Tae2 family protein